MDLELQHKRVLVTGSTAGIGFSIAKRLAKEGAIVYLSGRTKERIEGALEALRQTNEDVEVYGIVADLTNEEGTERLTAQIPAIDILVNNLGIYQSKEFCDISDEEWLNIFEINVMSGVRLCRFYLPHMKAQNWGRILFISSAAAVQTPPNMIHYGMTKTAQLALARGLAESVVGTGITVNSLLANATRSEGAPQIAHKGIKETGKDDKQLEEAFFKQAQPSTWQERLASPEQVAAMAAFISSPHASGVNGAALRVEGGVIHSIL